MTEGRYAEGSVTVGVDGPLATVSLTRPGSLNAQTPHTWAALRDIGSSLDPAVRVVVVRGAGRAFSTGLDRRLLRGEGAAGGLSTLARIPAAEADSVMQGYQEAFGWLRADHLVSIAAVQGHAVGAGFQLALACDLRVLADDAQLCMAETTLELVPDLGGTKPLVSLVGPARALEICLTGRRVGAAEALRIGLATLVVPTADLDEAVADLVAALLSPPAAALGETKALIYAAASRSSVEQETAERAAQLRRIRDLTGASAGDMEA